MGSELQQALESLRLKFSSMNSIPVERATITCVEYAAIRDALAHPAPSVPDGWRLVPVKPTTGMVCACISGADNAATIARSNWAAMLAAAPSPPVSAPIPDEYQYRLKGGYGSWTNIPESALGWLDGGEVDVRALYDHAAPPAPSAPACKMRGGHGVVDRFMQDGSFDGQPCPDCCAPYTAPPAPQVGDGHHGADTDTHVFFYERDFYVLSNFSAFAVMYNALDFPTSEHAYHWMKFNAPGDDQHDIRARIRLARSAHDAFKIAEKHKVDRRADWDEVKADVMLDILRVKAAQHEYVRRKLIATGDRILVEDSWRDDVWGWGPNRDGQNLLGKLWMQVRSELIAALGEKAS